MSYYILDHDNQLHSFSFFISREGFSASHFGDITAQGKEGLSPGLPACCHVGMSMYVSCTASGLMSSNFLPVFSDNMLPSSFILCGIGVEMISKLRLLNSAK